MGTNTALATPLLSFFATLSSTTVLPHSILLLPQTEGAWSSTSRLHQAVEKFREGLALVAGTKVMEIAKAETLEEAKVEVMRLHSAATARAAQILRMDDND